MSETVQVIRTEHVGVVEVRLNRPEKMNAISAAMFSDLVEARESLMKQKFVTCIR